MCRLDEVEKGWTRLDGVGDSSLGFEVLGLGARG